MQINYNVNNDNLICRDNSGISFLFAGEGLNPSLAFFMPKVGTMEIWKDIQGYEGIYQVSNNGRIKSLTRQTKHNRPGDTKITKGRIMKNCDNGNGYLQAHLYKNQKRKAFYIHFLVAKHFITNPENKPQVNHRDNTHFNNNSTNLEWSTQKENGIMPLA
jgi:hypothetical protein